VRPQDVVGAIANEAAIPGRAIGAIDILDAYTFVDIPREFVDQVLAAMRSASIKGRRVNAEIARPDGWAATDRAGRDGRPREPGAAYPPRREFVGGGRVRRDRDDAQALSETGVKRRFDRTGPARFRVRRDGPSPRPTRRDE
jgi:hypothetical protein